MKIIEINDINYNTDLTMDIQKKDEFLMMCGEGRVDEDGDKIEAFIFKLDRGNSVEYYGFSEQATYIFRGDF